MRDFTLIADALAEAECLGEPVVLATVVRTEGSTYRRAGARMLMRRDGTTVGAVSGGCLEADIAARVGDLLLAGEPELVTYDTRAAEDIVWGLGLGCNGRVDVLLEPLAGDALARSRVVHAWSRDVTAHAVLTTVIAADVGANVSVGARLALAENGGTAEWGLAREPAPPELLAGAWEALAARRSSVRAYLSIEVVHEVVAPPIALLVCGAGTDAAPLVRLAVGLGWRATVMDHRGDDTRAEQFPNTVIRLAADEGADAFRGHDAAVLMSHHYEHDREWLRRLLDAGVPYIGVLGPRRRTARMIEELGASEGETGRLYAPVGLDIGAETPDEIALAIVAEILAVRSGRQGGPLRARPGAIHSESTSPSMVATTEATSPRCDR